MPLTMFIQHYAEELRNRMYVMKGAGSFHIHRKTMKELCTLAVLGVQEQQNLAKKHFSVFEAKNQVCLKRSKRVQMGPK